MELRVNDYVRTKKRTLQPPQIARIKSMQKDSGYHNLYYIELDHNLIPYYNFHIYTDDIDKSSPKIIDLAKIGDYVNGLKITLINEPSMANCNKRLLYAEDEEGYLIKMFDEQDIKSIVTKEMYSSMEYKVGE